MSAESHALSLPKTKRKRRKPPRRQFWIAFAMVCYYVVFMTFDVVYFYGVAGDTFSVVWGSFLLLFAAHIMFFWPAWWFVFLYELKLWRQENDDG